MHCFLPFKLNEQENFMRVGTWYYISRGRTFQTKGKSENGAFLMRQNNTHRDLLVDVTQLLNKR